MALKALVEVVQVFKDVYMGLRKSYTLKNVLVLCYCRDVLVEGLPSVEEGRFLLVAQREGEEQVEVVYIQVSLCGKDWHLSSASLKLPVRLVEVEMGFVYILLSFMLFAFLFFYVFFAFPLFSYPFLFFLFLFSIYFVLPSFFFILIVFLFLLSNFASFPFFCSISSSIFLFFTFLP